MVSLDTVGIYIMHVGVVCRPNRACVHILFNNINTIPGCAFDITSSLLRVGLWRPLSSPILPFQLLISPSSFSRHFVPYLGMPFRNLAGRAVGRVLTRPASLPADRLVRPNRVRPPLSANRTRGQSWRAARRPAVSTPVPRHGPLDF